MAEKDILGILNAEKEKLAEIKEQLEELEGNYDLLIEYERQCALKINNFEESIATRKSRLTIFDGVTGSVKIAAGYSKKMNNMLTGTEYHKVTSAISDLLSAISDKKGVLIKDIQDVENEIEKLEKKIEGLEIEYEDSKRGGKDTNE